MFSFHDVIEVAVTIERNTEQTYRGAARKIGRTDLASLLDWLADQEQKHRRWFASLGARVPKRSPPSELEEMGRAMLRDAVGDKKFSLDDVDLTAMAGIAELLDAAIDLELDTVVFYQLLAGFMDDEESLIHLEEIVEEEKRHGRLLTEYRDGL